MPCSGPSPLVVAFTATPGGGVAPYTFMWTFGDGGTSTVQNPTYTYTEDGEYTAVCTITDLCGSQTTQTTSVSVSGGIEVLCCPGVLLPATLTAEILCNGGTTSLGSFPVAWDGTKWAGSGSVTRPSGDSPVTATLECLGSGYWKVGLIATDSCSGMEFGCADTRDPPCYGGSTLISCCPFELQDQIFTGQPGCTPCFGPEQIWMVRFTASGQVCP